MASADQKPGRRRATPEPRRRRAPEPKAVGRRRAPAGHPGPKPTRLPLSEPVERVEQVEAPPAEPPPTTTAPAEPEPAALEPARPTRAWARAAATAGWALLLVDGLVALAARWTPYPVPALVPAAGSVLVTGCYAFALAVRSGGRPLLTGAVALALGGAAVVTAMPVLLAGAAVTTAALGAVLGILVSKPAARFPQVVRECVIGALVAAAAALAAEGYDAPVAPQRAGYLVLGLAIAGALALVYRLGAGVHGLGRRGVVMVASGVGLLVVSLAYTAALARWGPPGLLGDLGKLVQQVRAVALAVPRPMELLLGFPGLAWSVSTRARRRQGWWAAVFGAAGLGVVAASLLDPAVSLVGAGLSLTYSLVLGLLLGYLVIRADRFLSGARGRRARRAEEAAAHRPEPGRLHPLM